MNWPPILCPKCWAMKFLVGIRIAQCTYCGYMMHKKGE